MFFFKPLKYVVKELKFSIFFSKRIFIDKKFFKVSQKNLSFTKNKYLKVVTK
jgi:hypothetical protein